MESKEKVFGSSQPPVVKCKVKCKAEKVIKLQ